MQQKRNGFNFNSQSISKANSTFLFQEYRKRNIHVSIRNLNNFIQTSLIELFFIFGKILKTFKSRRKMNEHKILSNLNRNSPAKFQKYLTGKVSKGSPLSTRKIKQSAIANYIDNNENEVASNIKKKIFSDANEKESQKLKECGLCGNTTKKLKLTE